MAYKVNIFKKKNNKVLETKKFSSEKKLNAFKYYWYSQADTKNYGFEVE